MEKNLTKGSPLRLIVSFAIPLLLGNLFQQIYNVVDMFIVGRTLGANSLAAVGCTGSILFFIIGFIYASTAGFSIVTAQRFGAQDAQGVRKSFSATVLCSAIIGVLLTVFCVAYTDEILKWMRTPDEIYAEARAYLFVIFLGIMPGVLFNLLSNTILALGDSKTPLVFLFITCLLNVVMDYAFILYCGWGVGGAAWATVVAQTLSAILCIIYVYHKQPILILKKEDFRLSIRELYGSMRIGLPMGFQCSIIALGCIAVQMNLNDLGPIAVAAFATANKVDLLATMPLMSFGIAMATYVGQNYGAKKIVRIREGVHQCCLLSLSVSIIMGAVNIFFGHFFVEMFVGKKELELVELAQMYLGIQASTYWILSLLFVYRYTLQGLGKSFVPTFAGVMELVMRVGASLLLVAPLGFGGVCLASPLAWVGSALPLWIAYRGTMRNMTRSMIPDHTPVPSPELPTAYPSGATQQ